MLPAGFSPLLPIHAVTDALRSVGRGVGDTVQSQASSKAGCLKQDRAALGRASCGKSILDPVVVPTSNNFGIVWDYVHLE